MGTSCEGGANRVLELDAKAEAVVSASSVFDTPSVWCGGVKPITAAVDTRQVHFSCSPDGAE